MSYHKRMGMLIVIDSFIVLFSVYVSNAFFSFSMSENVAKMLFVSSLSLFIFHQLFAQIFGLYRKAWEYASVGEMVHIVKAITLSVLSTALIQFIVFKYAYLHVLVVVWMMNVILIGGSRFMWRILRDGLSANDTTMKKRTLIIGAGAGGTMTVRQLQQDEECNLLPVAFVDDEKGKQRLEIFNIPVLGTVEDIQYIVKNHEIEHIIIAIPSLTRTELETIYNACQKTKVKTQIIPRLEDIAEGKISVSQIRDVSVEDLLGRDTVKLDDKGISDVLTNKTIMVTGAGGSIGSEICRQVLKYKPSKLVLLGHGENSIYTIEMELLETYRNSEIEIVTVIADVQDRHNIFGIVEKHKPHLIYHAAAHKHVPLMERSPGEAVKNNVFGTRNVAEAADTFGVGTFVMVSTDKAVNPTNVMGTTKRMAEMVIQGLDKISDTRFVAVRFGNVLGSRGSVIPRFQQQIAKGGPVTVTHPEMTRFFMTIPEASRLVIQAGSFAKGGEIFVLDMNKPVKIIDLAKNLITLSGYSLEEIEIQYSGLRPGEKMYEELLMDDENLGETSHKKIFIGQPIAEDYKSLNEKLEDLESYLYDGVALREKLAEIVPTYEMAEHDKKILVGNK